MISEYVNFSVKNNTGIIKLNRPKALNAINFEMIINFTETLLKWKDDPSIRQVLLFGKGNSLCAGGDVKSLFLSSNKNLKKIFFQKEYLLNNLISEFSKNYLSVWDGLVMGGGVGLSIYGNYRLTSEKTKFAMPETAIGFFPDVGGSFFLSQLKKGVGMYLGLTGNTCNAKDIMELGLATHYIPSKLMPETIEKYIEKGVLNELSYYPEMPSDISSNKKFIEDTFQYDLPKIISKLKNSNNEFGQKIYSHILTRCPMSLATTVKLIKNAQSKTLKECLEIEYQLSQRMVYREDFNNGVDAVLINKNHKANWNPSTVENIDYGEVDKMFELHVEKLYI